MKKSFVLILLLAGTLARAQMYEIGVFAGGANTISDVGRTDFILPSNLAYGGIFKWNASKRYSWRASVIYGNLTADDSKSNISSRKQRGYLVKNSVLEASAGLEFNFVEYNLHKLGPAFTPYLYTGITYFRYDYNYFNAGQLVNANQRDGSLALPMTLGMKLRVGQQFIIGAEVGARYTFTDNLDASNPSKSNISQQLDVDFGNTNSKDWYVFSGFTFTYTFGRVPCGDCFE